MDVAVRRELKIAALPAFSALCLLSPAERPPAATPRNDLVFPAWQLVPAILEEFSLPSAHNYAGRRLSPFLAFIVVNHLNHVALREYEELLLFAAY